MNGILIGVSCFLALVAAADPSSAQVAYPIKVSDEGRYFVDQKGVPFFWLGTTQWQLFREYSIDDARTAKRCQDAYGAS